MITLQNLDAAGELTSEVGPYPCADFRLGGHVVAYLAVADERAHVHQFWSLRRNFETKGWVIKLVDPPMLIQVRPVRPGERETIAKWRRTLHPSVDPELDGLVASTRQQ